MKPKKHIGIEIFPAEKSCEQGCSVCPLSNRGNQVTNTEINGEVQETFYLLEKYLYNSDVMYDMHFTSLFHLFPKLKRPELIYMSRFETNKRVRMPNAPREFSENIKFALEENHIDPKVIGFSIVPMVPVVSEPDANIISELLDEITSWYFQSTYKKIQVTVRTNMLPMEKFEQALPYLLSADEMFLRKIVEDRSIVTHFVKDSSKHLREFPDGHLYGSFYYGRQKTNRIFVGNRVIAPKKNFDIVDQAFHETPRITQDVAFAIAPKGVMLVHSSTAINNPIRWMSHKDFRDSLKKVAKLYSSRYFILQFCRQMIFQNAVMYDIAQKYKNEEDKFSQQDYMDIFQNFRPEIFKKLAHL